jgi:hypothetical protein
MNQRRDPFETAEPAPTIPAAPSLYDSLRVAAPRKRNRQWEKQQQSRKVVYRGIDPKLALKVKTIAGNLHVPEGEVARAVIEHALRCYERGDFDLHPRPNPLRLRMTLFPVADAERSGRRMPRSSAKGRSSEALWKVITTWRGFPPELKQELAALASDDGLHVPIGELITALLRFGLKAYDSGSLALEPVQITTAYTLAQTGKK